MARFALVGGTLPRPRTLTPHAGFPASECGWNLEFGVWSLRFAFGHGPCDHAPETPTSLLMRQSLHCPSPRTGCPPWPPSLLRPPCVGTVSFFFSASPSLPRARGVSVASQPISVPAPAPTKRRGSLQWLALPVRPPLPALPLPPPRLHLPGSVWILYAQDVTVDSQPTLTVLRLRLRRSQARRSPLSQWTRPHAHTTDSSNSHEPGAALSPLGLGPWAGLGPSGAAAPVQRMPSPRAFPCFVVWNPSDETPPAWPV